MRAAFDLDVRHGVGRDVERLDLGALPRETQREAAVIAERVEQPPTRVARRRLAVLALIEKQPGLLPSSQIDLVLDRPFAHGHRVGNRAGQVRDRLLETFERAHLGIVAGEDAGRREQLLQQLRDRRQQPIHALRERLHDEVVAVPIDDERRQQIRLAVNESIGRRIELQRFPELNARARAASAAATRRRAPRRA